MARFLVLFGRVSLFYCVAGILLLHALAVAFSAAVHGDVARLFGGPPIEARPAGYGLGLPGVYLVWMTAAVALDPPCRWFADLKRRRGEGWLSRL